MQSQDPLLGLLVDGRFEVLERIGSGGMGTVYRARQLSVDRDVAVKFIHESAAGDPERARRFEKEARIIARLEDPHTLKLIDFGIDRGRRYLVTEYLQGETLADRLARASLSAEAVRDLLRPICDALAEAHEQGVVHRDLKPHNIFLQRIGDREVVRVLDFGIARWHASELSTTTGALAGSPAYMSPEQARGDEVDGRSDLYALGVLAYECLAGRLPFQARTPALMLVKQLHDLPKPFDELSPPAVVPQAMEALVLHLLEKDPQDRPASARVLAQRLDGLRWDAPVEVARAEPAPEPVPSVVWTPPRRWPWGVAALAVAAVVAVAVWPGQAPEVIEDSGVPDARVPDARVPDARVAGCAGAGCAGAGCAGAGCPGARCCPARGGRRSAHPAAGAAQGAPHRRAPHRRAPHRRAPHRACHPGRAPPRLQARGAPARVTV
jgi:serine/threonine protein kinase